MLLSLQPQQLAGLQANARLVRPWLVRSAVCNDRLGVVEAVRSRVGVRPHCGGLRQTRQHRNNASPFPSPTTAAHKPPHRAVLLGGRMVVTIGGRGAGGG